MVRFVYTGGLSVSNVQVSPKHCKPSALEAEAQHNPNTEALFRQSNAKHKAQIMTNIYRCVQFFIVKHKKIVPTLVIILR